MREGEKGKKNPADGVPRSWGTCAPELQGVMGIPQPHSCACTVLCCALFPEARTRMFVLEKCCPTFVCPHLNPCPALAHCVISNKPYLLCIYKSKGVLFECHDSAGGLRNLFSFPISVNNFRLILL